MSRRVPGVSLKSICMAMLTVPFASAAARAVLISSCACSAEASSAELPLMPSAIMYTARVHGFSLPGRRCLCRGITHPPKSVSPTEERFQGNLFLLGAVSPV